MEKQLSEVIHQNKAMEVEGSNVRRTLSEGNHETEPVKVQYISRDNTAMQKELIQQIIQTQHQLGIGFGRALLLITRMNTTGLSKSTQKRPGNMLLDHIYIEQNNSQLQEQTNGKQCLLCLEDLRDEDSWEELKEEEEEEVQILEQQPIRRVGEVEGIEQKAEIKDVSDELVIIDKDSVISVNSKSNLEISDENQVDLNIIDCEMDGTDKLFGFINLATLDKHSEELKQDEKKEQGKLKEGQTGKQEKINVEIKDKSNSNSDKEKITDQKLNGAVLAAQQDEKPIPLVLKKKKYALGCKHFFCGNCFEAYVKAIFQEGSSCIYKTCPLDGCLERLGRDDFKHFLTANLFLLPQAIQCPASGCNLVQVASTDAQTLKNRQESIICECSHEYCNLCREISHFPSDCQEFRKWLTKLEIEGIGSLNDQWIIMNTKPCPKCNVNIEKNQGCLHMTCKPCGHHFCWMCLGEWKSHTDYYKCTRFDAAKIKEIEDKKKELSRFRFHSGHYDTHQANVIAVKCEISELFQEIASVNSQLSANGMKSIETKNIRQFCDLILKARKYLPFLYAKGYFITDPEKLEFFNNLLEDYVRILDIYNRNLENFIGIIETTTPRLTIKTSFYMALHSLPKKINSLEKYISRQVYQFTKGLEHLEQAKKRTVTSIPENINAIFEIKKQKVAAKEKEKAFLEKKRQKLAEKEQEKELNNKQKNQITIFIDSDSEDDNDDNKEENQHIDKKSVESDRESSSSNSEQREASSRNSEIAKTITDQSSGSKQTLQILERFAQYRSFTEELLNTEDNEEVEKDNCKIWNKHWRKQTEINYGKMLLRKRQLQKQQEMNEEDLESESEEDTTVIGISKGNSKVERDRIGMENQKKNNVIQRKRIKHEEQEEEEEEEEDMGENVYKICQDCKKRPIENEYGVCEKCFEKFFE